ncbi:UNVERIFIED_CONTAM: hypothetical protein RMT77_004083 [Armadillidium vulgare]
MPTPPLKRRNPAVSIRRVQSERRNLTTWGGPPMFPTWKYKYDYARRTVIIPPIMSQPHMIGTSQGVLGRNPFSGFNYPLPHSVSEAHLQPLFLVAPPLIVGAYPQPRKEFFSPRRIPMTEDEILSQERIKAFLKEIPPTHSPKSQLSYPESHVYESLISRGSDSSKDESSEEEENIYQKLTKSSEEYSDDQWSESSSFENKKGTVKLNKEFKVIGRVPEFFEKSEDKIKATNTSKGEGKLNDYISKPLQNRTSNYLTFTKSAVNKANDFVSDIEQKLEENAKTHQNPHEEKKKLSFLSCSKMYLKSIFRSKKKENEDNKNCFQNVEVLPIPTAVSVVHVNKENGADEVSVRESVCYKCDGRLGGQSHSDIGSANNESKKVERYHKIQIKSQSLDFAQGKRIKRSSTFASGSKDSIQFRENSRNIFSQRSPLIPPTVELPESVPHKSNFSTERKSDKGVQVSSEDIARSQNDLETFLTLDPLKPALPPRDIRTKIHNNTLRNCRNFSNNSNHSKNESFSYSIRKNQRNRVRQNSFTTHTFHPSPNLLKNNEKNAFLSQRSMKPKNRINLRTDDDSILYVFGTHKKSSDKSSSVPSTDHYKINTGRGGGGSSGLGSSGGSETSYEEAAHSNSCCEGTKILQETFTESSSRSSYDSSLSSLSSLKSNRGEKSRKLCFDYSWSWNHLNDLVRKIPAIETRRRKTSPSLDSLSLSTKFKDISRAFENS